MHETHRVQVGLRRHVTAWLSRVALTDSDIDCINAVMLKILDGKCKMPEQEKRVMAELYRQIDGANGRLLGDDVHQLIAQAQVRLDESMRLQIYEFRLLAEIRIARPVMKAFKGMIRERGLLDLDG